MGTKKLITDHQGDQNKEIHLKEIKTSEVEIDIQGIEKEIILQEKIIVKVSIN